MVETSKKLNLSTKILCLIIGAYLITLLIVPQYLFYATVIIIAVDAMYLLINNEIIIKINSVFFLWIMFILISFVGLVISKSTMGGANQYVLSLIAIFFNYIILVSIDGWEKYLIKVLIFVSFIFVGGSILQLIAPNILLTINSMFMSEFHYLSSLQFINNNYLVSFSHNTGVNGYVLSFLLLYLFIIMYTTDGKIKKLFFTIAFLFTYYFLFMTGKRGFLLFTLVIILYLILILQKRKLTVFIPIIIIALAFYLILINTEIGRELINRTVSSDDITTGRMPVYIIMWEDFLDKPFWGSGTFSTLDVIYLYHGHNIYLQILREHGFIGFAIFVSVLIINFIRGNRVFKKITSKENKIIVSVGQSAQLLFILWGITGNPLYDIYPVILYFIGSALIWKVYTQEKIKEKTLNEMELLKLSLGGI